MLCCMVFFQAEDGIRDLVRSRGLGDVYKRQVQGRTVKLRQQFGRALAYIHQQPLIAADTRRRLRNCRRTDPIAQPQACLLYTSDAADERSSVDLGGRRIIKKKKQHESEHRGLKKKKHNKKKTK